MYEETIDTNTKRVLEEIVACGALEGALLAGGTALALQLGHRVSVDLDFFLEKDFSLKEKRKKLFSLGGVVILGEEDGTLHASVQGVLVSFLRYPYPLLFPTVPFLGISLVDTRDIACMKLEAIASRGSKKDFVDMFFLLQHYSLEEIFDFFSQKYQGVSFSLAHIAKSMAYFEDAEREPMPKMLKNILWEDVRERICQEAMQIVDRR